MKPLQDNKGRHTEGNKVQNVSKTELKALQELSSKTIWDLTLSDDVMYVGASIGKKLDSNKERKIIELGYCSPDNSEVQVYTDNTMGFVCVNGVDIFVTSRFDEEGCTNFLMHLLSIALGWTLAKDMVSTNPKTEALSDLQFMLFPKFLKDALGQGIIKMYKHTEYNDMRVKGRVDVSRQIKQNIPFNGRIAYTSREYSENNHIIQLIRHTIEYIKQEYLQKRGKNNSHDIFDKSTNDAISTICRATPDYRSKDFSQILSDNMKNPVSHPYYTKYRPLQELCISILKRKKIGFGGKNKKGIHGILFDGAWLWEEYISYVLNKKDDNGITFRHYTDKNSHFSLFEGFSQKIIPDYLSDDYNEAENKAIAVGDAKYMRLEGKDKLQNEQAYSVYYKTIMYMHRFNSQKGFIFYPMEPDAEENDKSPKVLSIAGTESKIYMCGFRIPKIEASKDPDGFTKFKSAMEKAEEDFRNQIKTYLTNN